MKRKLNIGVLVLVLMAVLIFWQFPASGQAEQLRCIAFSPYVDNLNPNWPPHPTPQLIDQLLDIVKNQLGFNCILVYGMTNGLDHAVDAAHTRGMKVIANMWLSADTENNTREINAGIAKAKAFPDTVVRLSCGSELLTRMGNSAELYFPDCYNRVKAAGVAQPVGIIDTWWPLCYNSWPCRQRPSVLQLDWVGVNVYPWWENKYSGLFPCTTAEQAPDFHIARFNTIQTNYPGKKIMLTEFGWPAGPEGYTESNNYTGQSCGIAGESNQRLVITESIKKLDQAGIDFSLFEAFREPWKTGEGPVGPWWGVCDGMAPYRCHGAYGYIFTHQIFLPFIKK